MLTKISGAKRILEIGTLGGYSTLWFAKGADKNGKIVTLELETKNAEVAQENFDHSPYKENIEMIVGEAKTSLEGLLAKDVPPFDLIFIDADKGNNPVYLDYSLQLSQAGTVIIADNIIRDGEILNSHSTDERVIGVQTYLDKLADSAKLESTAVETMGVKGFDGFSLSVVKG